MELTRHLKQELVSKLLHLHFKDDKTRGVWRRCTAAHGRAVEDLRLGSGHPQCPAGPGRGPGPCGRGTAGEGAASAASGLLGVSTLTPAACLRHGPAPCPRVSCGLWLQTGKRLLIPDSPTALEPGRSQQMHPFPSHPPLSPTA
ncbi:centromere protein X isoform X2 [Rhinolophus sinicus]|uniref:centromere protein X isoform X2 n=1 Tax=Rhinolophus sinicus TaxID=89399 RepID=UPI003D78C4C4